MRGKASAAALGGGRLPYQREFSLGVLGALGLFLVAYTSHCV
jgi:hypothetical protein